MRIRPACRLSLALLLLASPLSAQIANEPMAHERVRHPFFKDRSVLALAAVSTAAQVADGVTTVDFERRGYIEVDPISRFLLGERPTWSRMAPIGAAEIVGTAFIAHRMRYSRNRFVHAMWWLPQSIFITVPTAAAIHNENLR